MADEAHHRDVNHTFADMKSDDPNPFVTTHKGENIKKPRINLNTSIIAHNTVWNIF